MKIAGTTIARRVRPRSSPPQPAPGPLDLQDRNLEAFRLPLLDDQAPMDHQARVRSALDAELEVSAQELRQDRALR